jgi:hypothetical protein
MRNTLATTSGRVQQPVWSKTGSRKAVAVACIALVLVAAVLPFGGVSIDWVAVVPAEFVLLQPLAPIAAVVESPRCYTPTAICLNAISFRGPPSASLA